jgi:phage gpG-like protein
MLRTLASVLAGLDFDSVLRTALSAQAQRMADAVRTGLAGTPGGEHAAPWERSGALHDSIGSVADAAGAVVGSADPVARYQELGTARIPPRPFLAPVGAAEGADAATAVGEAVAEAVAAAIRQAIGGR